MTEKTGFKIAISGKGGVGKTTLCAVWASLLAQDGMDVLAIDADSNPTLVSAMGLAPEDSPQPLIDMKELIQERTEAKPGAVGNYFKLNPDVSDIPDKFSIDVDGVKLLVLGGIDDPGRGCACPESAFLKALLTYSILRHKDAILVDLAAGVEFLGRACIQGVDGLVVVVEPGVRSIDTALDIAKMAKEMGISKIAAFANKISDPDQVKTIQDQLGTIPLLGHYYHDPAIQAADLNRKAVSKASDKLITTMAEAKAKLLNLFFGVNND